MHFFSKKCTFFQKIYNDHYKVFYQNGGFERNFVWKTCFLCCKNSETGTQKKTVKKWPPIVKKKIQKTRSDPPRFFLSLRKMCQICNTKKTKFHCLHSKQPLIPFWTIWLIGGVLRLFFLGSEILKTGIFGKITYNPVQKKS